MRGCVSAGAQRKLGFLSGKRTCGVDQQQQRREDLQEEEIAEDVCICFISYAGYSGYEYSQVLSIPLFK
jgi:hypothetical protein